MLQTLLRMRRFLASAWFPFLTALVLAIATVGSLVWLKPTGEDIGNSQILEIVKMAAWGVGPVIGLLSLSLMFILNGIRRLTRLRKVAVLHPVVVLLGLAPFAVFAWQLVMNEPRYTPIARAVIDFAGKEMFLGSAAAILFALILSLGLLIPSGSKQ